MAVIINSERIGSFSLPLFCDHTCVVEFHGSHHVILLIKVAASVWFCPSAFCRTDNTVKNKKKSTLNEPMLGPVVVQSVSMLLKKTPQERGVPTDCGADAEEANHSILLYIAHKRVLAGSIFMIQRMVQHLAAAKRK